MALYSTPFASARMEMSPFNLYVERQGHTATPLADGKIVIIGGESATGPTDQSEIYDPVTKTHSTGPLSLAPRTEHTATPLADGRVLVTGGRDPSGRLASTEIYDPAAKAFANGPLLNRARAGHSATVLTDGRILIVGGDDQGTAEVYDPSTQASTLLGRPLGTPRAFHGAALLKSGKVLIVGGSGGLSSAELFSPATGAFAPVANGLEVGRVRPTLRVLPDGKVQVIGGATDRSIEIYDPVDNLFGAHAKVLNGSNAAGDVLNTQTRGALIYRGSTLDPALDDLLNRGNHSLTELPQRNEELVGGGVDSGNQILNSAYVLGSSQASVTTDKLDYAPFDPVTVSGAGWQPGETVEIVLHEEPNTGPDIPPSVQVDNRGKFFFDTIAPDMNDIGVTFTLTAWGVASGFTAQTAFTDQPPRIAQGAVAGFGVLLAADPALADTTVTATFTATGGEQAWSVPGNVTKIHATAVGARGGNGGASGSAGRPAQQVDADLPIPAGVTKLYVEVGQPGGDNGSPRGFGGGARGGFAAGPGGGAGGGASDIRTCSLGSPCDSLSSRLVVAGGGGGGRCIAIGCGSSGNGADGGPSSGGSGGLPTLAACRT